MVDAALFSSADTGWQTPERVLECVRELDAIGLDPCTTKHNPAGALNYYTPAQDGLKQSWLEQSLIFMNPPYGREIVPWVEKAVEAVHFGAEIISLVPARTDTRWFADLLFSSSCVCLVTGRLKFKGAKASAPFPSAVLYAGPRHWGFVAAFKKLGICVDRSGGWYGG